MKLEQILFSLALSIVSLSVAATDQNLLIKNANGYTFDNAGDLVRFNRMLVRQGKVVSLDGSPQDIEPNLKVVDVGGKTILPGLTDAHGHLLSLGFNLLSLDVRGVTSAAAVAAKVSYYAETHPELIWIKGRGWNQVLWPGKAFPQARELDKVIADRPVWLRRIDGHAGWANTRAMRLAGIDSETLAPSGGEILRDKNGQPTGVLIDNAMSLLESKIPIYTADEMASALKVAQTHLLALGITSMHDAGISFAEYGLYRELAKNGQLDIRIYAMLSSTDPQLDEMLAQGHVKDANGHLSIRSVKVYADGALGSRGAAMLAPYSDRPGHSGLLLTSAEDLRRVFKKSLEHDFQINVHAIGDRGARIALDEYEYAFPKWGGAELRNRIEHSQVVDLLDIPRYKMLGVVPSMQPTHATSDMNMAQDRIGKKRLLGAYAWRKFLDQGSRIASGSDFPVEFANPFFGLHAAVTRQNRDSQPPGGWIPEEAMTIKEALRSFTIDAAWAAHQEQAQGGLTAGKWADFILIDGDVFTMPAADLWKVKVLQTWIAGSLVEK